MMSDPILVRGEISKAVAWSRTLVPLGVILGAALFWFAPPPIGLIVGIVFGIIWIWLEIYVARQRFRQMWLRDTGDGFDLIDRAGERHIADNQIHSVSLRVEPVYYNGVQSATKRAFTVWSDLEPDPVLFESKFKHTLPDPLSSLIHRVIKNVHQRTEAAIANGEILSGLDWQLDKQKLAWGKGEVKQSLNRAEIVACEEFDGHICIWRAGQDEAIAKFKLGMRNVCLLPHLLQTSPEESANTEEKQSGLGRILFDRKPGSVAVYGLGCLGLVVMLLGGLLVLAGLANRNEITIAGVGVTILVVGTGVAFLGYTMRFKSFRCHERGVVQLGFRSRKELKYEDTGAFTYSAVRNYHNGAYIGTAIAMKFTPLPESNAPKISYSTSIKNEDAAIEELRNFISRAIAGRMAQRLAGGQEVPWTPNLTFTPEGIVYRAPGFVGRKEAKLLAYDDFGGQNLDQGVFYLFQKGEKKAVMNEQASAVNFFPGFFLLLTMQE